MKRRVSQCLLIAAGLIVLPMRSPAPFIYTPGEGWSYESVGGKGSWHRENAKAQLAVAQAAFDQKDYRLAFKAATRVVTVWPLSDYAPPAQYLIGRCDEGRKMDEKAFNAYQAYIDKYPRKVEDQPDIQKRQFDIAVRFLNGEWFKLWGYIPFFPSMDKTSDMFDKIVRFGPYGPYGPGSQMDIGAAREKQKDWPLAVQAYERAADRYSEQTRVASDALFKAAGAQYKQARKSDYDQSVAGEAIASYNDFKSLYPDDPRVTNADFVINSLKAEQARGNFSIAQFYEKEKKWTGALIYYNEVLQDAASPLATQARQRVEALKQRAVTTAPPRPPPPIPSPNSVSALIPMRALSILLLALAAAVAGCAGYKLGPTNGMASGAKTIAVRPFVNKTREPRVTEYLAMSLRRLLQQDGTFRLQTSGAADVILTGEILTYGRTGLSYTTNDVLTPQEYVLTVDARFTARDTSTGKTTFDHVVRGTTYLRIGEDLASSEREAMPVLTDNLARTAVNEMVDGIW